jgi:hypothetical protein
MIDVQRVRVVDDFITGGHRLLIMGRDRVTGGRVYLARSGETIGFGENEDIGDRGILLPEGVLDEVCRQHLGVTAPTTATERHLLDVVAVRDRTLTLVERLVGDLLAPPPEPRNEVVPRHIQ